MFKYNVKIQKVSGRLNESVLPSKSLVVKSNTKKTDKQVFAEASKYYKEKYGLVIESADVSPMSSIPTKPKRKAPLKKEVFSIEDIKELCKNEGTYDGEEYDYHGRRTTPDGREYELKISSCATRGKKFWIWTGSPYIKRTAYAVAVYDGFEGTWNKNRNNFIELVD